MNPIEQVARKLAANRMLLQKDIDGLYLPEELWRQCIPEAERLIGWLVNLPLGAVSTTRGGADDEAQ